VAVGKWKSLFDFQARGASVFSTVFSPASRCRFLFRFRAQTAIGQSVDSLQLALDPIGQLRFQTRLCKYGFEDTKIGILPEIRLIVGRKLEFSLKSV